MNGIKKMFNFAYDRTFMSKTLQVIQSNKPLTQ